MGGMCLNGHIVVCFLCPLPHYMYSINIYGHTRGSHFLSLFIGLFLLPSLSPYHHVMIPTFFTMFCSLFGDNFKGFSDATAPIPCVSLCPLGTGMQSNGGTRSYLQCVAPQLPMNCFTSE